jgi:MSHA biogenesis protein MshP
MRQTTCNERGFSLISAIFLLVVLAALGAAMANLSVMQHTGVAMDVQEARAYQAARAGVEWGLYNSLIDNAGGCPTNPTSFVPAAPTLAGFTVTVRCISTTNANTTPQITVRQLTSTACDQPVGGHCPAGGGAADHVKRIQVTF